MLHVTGITLGLSESAAGAVRAATGWARDAGVAVSIDLNYRSPALAAGAFLRHRRRDPATGRPGFGSGHELEYLVGPGDSAQLLEKAASLGPREVVLKRGGDGASALVDGELLETPAIRVPVVDTVGAGDAFVAGWLAEWISGAPARQRLRTAVECGAFACTVTSDWQGAPSRAELERWHDGGDPVQR